jgi:hypothetical protein
MTQAQVDEAHQVLEAQGPNLANISYSPWGMTPAVSRRPPPSPSGLEFAGGA